MLAASSPTAGDGFVTAEWEECDACDDVALRFCAVGALIHAAYDLTGEHEHAHRLGWKIAGMIAKAARLRPVDEDDAGWSLALLSDTRGQAAARRPYPDWPASSMTEDRRDATTTARG